MVVIERAEALFQAEVTSFVVEAWFGGGKRSAEAGASPSWEAGALEGAAVVCACLGCTYGGTVNAGLLDSGWHAKFMMRVSGSTQREQWAYCHSLGRFCDKCQLV